MSHHSRSIFLSELGDRSRDNANSWGGPSAAVNEGTSDSLSLAEKLRRIKVPRLEFLKMTGEYSSEDEDDPDAVDIDPLANGGGQEEEEEEEEILPQPKRKKQCPKWSELKKKPLDLTCEWSDCDFLCQDMEKFVKHVREHIPSLEVRTIETDHGEAEVWGCLWTDCVADIDDPHAARRHVYYHAYHTKLKTIGARLMSSANHPKCQNAPDQRNRIPEFPLSFQCNWEECGMETDNIHNFFLHAHAHAMAQGIKPVKGKMPEVPCLWSGCQFQARGTFRLTIHLYSHTKEKLVACPTCGNSFANRTKFYDHCSRQAPTRSKEYQCSHCSRCYASERLLRDHMRHHINTYKCPFCDMTSPTPSCLSLHIRCRHITDKPFKCEHCDYRGKTQHNLLMHRTIHFSQALYRCDREGCDYSCRTASTLKRHTRKMHEKLGDALYCCHICEQRFKKGHTLSKHLINQHNFRLPSGHTRFRYKEDSEGLFRLETVRYESLEVTQELLQDTEGGPLYITYDEDEGSQLVSGELPMTLQGGQMLPVLFLQSAPGDMMLTEQQAQQFQLG